MFNIREEFNKWYNEVFFAGPELKKVLAAKGSIKKATAGISKVVNNVGKITKK